jgi:hypothetical protein
MGWPDAKRDKFDMLKKSSTGSVVLRNAVEKKLLTT